MSPKHKVVWVGLILLILSLFVSIVRGPISFVLGVGISFLPLFFVSDLLKHGFLPALRGLPGANLQSF